MPSTLQAKLKVIGEKRFERFAKLCTRGLAFMPYENPGVKDMTYYIYDISYLCLDI